MSSATETRSTPRGSVWGAIAASLRGYGIFFWVGAGLLVVLLACAAFAPSLTGYGMDQQSNLAYAPPSPQHLFGTDEVGRDIFTRTAVGLRFDLMLISAAVPLSMLLGTMLGLLRVFASWIGELGQRVIDVILGIPAVILGLSISAALGPGALSLGLSIVVAGIPPFGRLARSTLLTLEHKDYIQAAKAFGQSPVRILYRHILPNTVTVLLTQLPISLVMAIILEASLSVIGLGLPPPSPTLGGLISAGRANIYVQVWYVIGPAIVFATLAIALVMIAEGIKGKVRD